MKQENSRHHPAVVLFFTVLFLFSCLDLCWPKRKFSLLENKSLTGRPAFSFASLLDNRWTNEYNEYVKEQFFLRDQWISMQSWCESVIFGKQETGGILKGADHMQFPRMYAFSADEVRQLSRNIQAVETFARRYPKQVVFLLVPTASLVYRDKLPAGAPLADEDAWMDDIFLKTGQYANTLDVREIFEQKKDEYLYYRTDHHWTTNGAFWAYEAFCRQMGLSCFDRSSHPFYVVEDFYGTNYSSSRFWDTWPDSIIYYPLDNAMTVYEVIGENQFEVRLRAGLYDTEQLEGQNKYGMFLYGNHGYNMVTGDGAGKLLVVKDSFANCFVPFLTANYERIDVVDLRNYPYSLDSLIRENKYDNILLLYSFQNFKTDPYLPNLMRESKER